MNTNEPNEQSEQNKITIDDSIKNNVFVFTNNKNIPLCQFIKSKDNQYIISVQKANPQTKPYIDYYYINKETGIIEKWETDGRMFTYKITENVVTDADIIKQESM